MSLFQPVLERRSSVRSRADPVQYHFIKVHAIMCTWQQKEELQDSIAALIDGGLISRCIAREKDKFKDLGASIALANIAVMLSYGQSGTDSYTVGVLRLLIEQHHGSSARSNAIESPDESTGPISSIDNMTPQKLALAKEKLAHASAFSFRVLSVALQQGPVKNIGPLIHIYLVFVRYLAIKAPRAMAEVQDYIPWTDLVKYLNQLIKSSSAKTSRITKNSFPSAEPGSGGRPLMEDYSLRGLVFTTDYPPRSCFDHQDSNDEERMIESASMHMWRVERILWLAHKIASLKLWMTFDEKRISFSSTGLGKQIRAPRLRRMAAVAPADVEYDSAMTEVGSERAADEGTVDTASSRTLSLHPQRTLTGSTMASEQSAGKTLGSGAEPQDVEMKDVAVDPAHRSNEVGPESWLDMSAKEPCVPPKFELQGIDPENYPIEIQDAGDDPSDPG